VRTPRQSELRESTDAEIVRLAKTGDAAAFERLYQMHCRKVYGLCLRMVGDSTNAQDLTQDIFLHLFRKINTFRGESAFSTWLHRISINIVLMRLRKKRIAETSLDTSPSADGELHTLPQEFGGPDLRLNGVVDRITLQGAINELAPGYKAMFVLHDVQGYNHSEIAEMLGCSVGNSKSQVHKARMQLRELLRKSLANSAHHHRKPIAGSVAKNRSNYTVDFANA
jgi:RNA polymerase sigma-70 factor, ECF subfamily